MRGELMVALMVFSLSVIAQKTSSIELSYDLTPTKLTHYNLSKPGEFEQKYKQPYYYIATFKYNQGFKKSTLGLGVRGFWINGNEKSIGAQLDYYRRLLSCTGIRVSYGANFLWDSYQFKDNQKFQKFRIEMHTLKVIPNLKVEGRIASSLDWRVSAGLGAGLICSNFYRAEAYHYEEELVQSKELWSRPFLAPSIGAGIVKYLR